ncbi:MAG: hypothetical protein CM15mP86_03330 [Gammaproteobacteria bacterium]|nr:MAG: hypothetical protein CM15mP86_03330 [Gammaproteobacteria bacterium]
MACLLLLASCSSSLVVQSDTDSQYDISAYKSFTIVTPTLADQDEMISINPILIQRISRSLESALTQKGLIKSDKADMTVRFYIGTREKSKEQLTLEVLVITDTDILILETNALYGQKKMKYL